MRTYKILLPISICLLIFSCKSSQSSFNYDYTYLYEKNQRAIKPQFKVFHHSTDSSLVYFKFKAADVLYGKFKDDSISKANVYIKYRVKNAENSRQVLDSNIIALNDVGENNSDHDLFGNFSFLAPLGKKLMLEIRFRDANRDLNVRYDVFIDKRLNNNYQFFRILDGKEILLDQYSSENKELLIEKSPLIESNSFLVESNNLASIKASPPFAMNNINEKIFHSEESDSLNFIDHKAKITLNAKRIRLIDLNLSTEEGEEIKALHLFSFHPSYPKISSYEQVIEPIRYISTNNEFKQLQEASDKKAAFENFWLKLGRDEETAKNLINIYYERVENANQFFTSFKEGWKTDRGIIMVVYGEPYEVVKTRNKEIWLYGEENNILSVKFEFTRRGKAWHYNDFKLYRDTNLKNNWYRAVDAWRQGKLNS